MVGFACFGVGWVCLGFCLLVASTWKLSKSFAKFDAGKLFNRLRVAISDNAQSLIGTGIKRIIVCSIACNSFVARTEQAV